MVNTVVELRNENEEVSIRDKRYLDSLLHSYLVVLDKAIAHGQIRQPEKKEDYGKFLLGMIFSLAILYKVRDRQSLYDYVDEQLSLLA